MGAKNLPKEFYALMEELQTIEFTLVELNLYLDTHPHDVNAINEYNRFVQELKRITQKIESSYGPLMNFGQSYVGCPFSWKDSPWPWQV